MRTKLQSWFVFRLLFQPGAAFERLAETRPSSYVIFFRYLIWLALAPPVFAFIGAMNSGWHIGAAEPIFMSTDALLAVSIAYFLTLLFGFISTAIIAQWMSYTYGARHSLGIHYAIVTIVAVPLAVGSVVHLYPHVFINVLVLIPTLIWSMYLLYRGLPIVLKISSERGMLMASSLIGWLLVAGVSVLGLTVALWGRGIGPSIGV